MSKPKQPKAISDTAPAAKVLPSSTERTIDYRQRQVSKGEIRWEISIPDKVKSAVTEIAKFEKLTAGVTAAKLLALGIEVYMAKNRSSETVVLSPEQKNACADIAFKLGNLTRSPATDIDSCQEKYHSKFPDEATPTPTPDRSFQPTASNLGGSVQNTTNGGDAPTEVEVNEKSQEKPHIADILKERGLTYYSKRHH